MRSMVLIFFVALLCAQTPSPSPKPPAAKPAASSPAKPKPAVAGAKPKPAVAGAKPAPAKPKPAAAKAKPAAAPAPAPLATDEEKTIYALGLSIQRSLAQFDLSAGELAIVKRAIDEAAAGKPAVELNQWGPRIEAFGRSRTGRVAEREKASSKAFLEKAAAQPGAVRTESGLVYREISPGSGASPSASGTVKVHYRGTLVNGTEFDSSYKRNEPAQFGLGQVIKCWTEGVQKMKAGGKSMLYCPSDIAYGDTGRPGIPGGAALIFEIELLEIVAPPAAK